MNYEKFDFEPIAEIDISKLKTNLEYIKDLAGDAKLCAVVKSNAYGHGMEIAKFIDKYADFYAVSKMDEAISLRFLGISKPILMLVPQSLDNVRVLSNYNVTLVCHSFCYLAEICKARFANDIYLSLKVDSGMKRLGFDCTGEFEEALKLISKNKNLHACGVYSHFYNSKSRRSCDIQYNVFNRFLSIYDNYFDGDRHISASGGLLHKKYNLDAVRIGILMYGYSPDERNCNVQPIMRIISKPINKRYFINGERCLYNSSSFCGEFALTAYGYADGLPRDFTPNRCMDLSYVSCKSDCAVILDDAKKVADDYCTIPYEVLVNSTKRIKKIYIGDI